MFQFKQFSIQQDRTPMKVGTDGVLLGAWADLEHAASILDVGTGTGLIALMGAQRNPKAHIDALEIEPDALCQARENISASPWGQRINVIAQSLQEYTPDFRYDCIVCNPPFFIHSTLPPGQGRSLARHCDSLPHAELVAHAARLLEKTGTFCVILPPVEARQLISTAANYQLFTQRITNVIPNPGKQPKRCLIKFGTEPITCREDELNVEFARHQYCPEYIALTREFYLKF